MRRPHQFWRNVQAAAAAGLALCLLTACNKPAAPAAGAAKPAPAKTTAAPAATNQVLVANVSEFVELMPPKGRDPFFPASRRREPVPVIPDHHDRPPPVAAQLELKGIVGAPNHRLALINNGILEVGETDTVHVPSGKIKVKCLEIGEDYAVVQAEGEAEPKRLELNKKGF